MQQARRNIMATPIRPTPVLSKREAVQFLKKVESNLGKPSHPVATPKLDQVRNLARKYAALQSK